MKINRRKEIMKEIYLLTKKCGGEVIKSAYEDANKALDEFNAAYRLNQKLGYKCTSQSESTSDSFVKVASCKKDG